MSAILPEHLLDIPVGVSVVLDQKMMPIRTLLEWEIGSVLRLDRSAGENVDVCAGKLPIGYGELVVIEDLMGVRITDFMKED